ncbi:uncharacterized protein A4U43_C09F1130 [Asparagus officinalis]|uniref:PHD-type domain-containing protein n=1 Tax=Asparagus officinalis TaxID=4686 RepID=A0A5P1E4U9_ASPOF|nr:uncharacterized protein A4U43_C09F1130 [Asparagus officinalis]
MDSGTLNENERIYYITKNNTENTSGFLTRKGIWCNCRKKLVSLSNFVAHAGGELQQSWGNIFLLSGKTLLLCLKEAWEKEKVQKKVGFQTVGVGDPDPSDDTCGICADGGHLICCDSCPSTFHQTCLMLKTLPEGSWYCPYCICTFCKALVHGLDMPLETQNLLSCRQCSRKYHKNCAWGNSMHMMGPVPSSFCGKNCQKVAVKLLDMLGITNSTEDGFSWTILKHFDKDSGIMSDQRFSFIMESNVKLSMALSVLNECFVPLIDQRTGVDMISQAVYNCGSNFNRLNYEGFYTLILERDEEIISAASLRLHGTRLAEMPFIGTRPMYRKQGMCRRLLRAVEEILRSLHVEKLIIPAIPDMLETWTTSFSFKPLEPSHKEEVKNLSLMVFAETTLLQKSLQRTEAFVQDDVMPVDKGISCKNLQENCELQRSFGDQINGRSNFGRLENIQEAHEPQKSFGDPTSNGTFSGSEINMQESHNSQRSFCRQIVAGRQPRSGNNIKENNELQRSFVEKIKTKSDLIDNGFHGKNKQESREQQRSFDDQINTRSHFGIANNIEERHDLERPYGASYGENIHDSYELQRSFANEIYTRSHFESENNIQESHELQRSFASRNHLGFSYGENIQDNYEPHKYPGNPGSTRSHVGMRNIQESEEVQRPVGDKINNSGHFVFQRHITKENEMVKSCSDQKNTIDLFGAAPDWLLYERILKGQIDPPSEICRILPPNTSRDSIPKASSCQHTLEGNIDPNSCKGSIPEPSPLQPTFMSHVNAGQHCLLRL